MHADISSNKTVTVVIPAFNREQTIKDAIESIFSQNLPADTSLEIIVVDDASKIPLKNILIPYIPRVKIITNKVNLGVSASRNIGVAQAKGQYVAFLDSDDLWLREKISMQLKLLNEEKSDICHTNEFWFRKDKFVNCGKKHTKYGGHIFSKILDKCRVSPSSLIIKKNVLTDCGGFDENLKVCEDYDLFLRLANTHFVSYINQRLIVKRAIANNSLSLNIKNIESLRATILYNFIKTNQLDKHNYCAAQKELARKLLITKGLVD